LSGSVDRFDLPLEVDGEPRTLRVTQTGAGAIRIVDGDDSADLQLLARTDGSVRYAIGGVRRSAHVACAGDGLHLAIGARSFFVREPSPWGPDPEADPSKITAPVSGAVVKLAAEPGQSVKAGEVLAVMEAMKMEMRLSAEADGTVSAVHARQGAQANSGSVLIELELKSQD